MSGHPCECWMGADACHPGEKCPNGNALEYGSDLRWLCLECTTYLHGPRGVPIMRAAARLFGHGKLAVEFTTE